MAAHQSKRRYCSKCIICEAYNQIKEMDAKPRFVKAFDKGSSGHQGLINFDIADLIDADYLF